MYSVTEKKLDVLLCEATSIVDKLSNVHSVSKMDVQHFGNALLDVQKEIHHQGRQERNESIYGQNLEAMS